MRIPIYRRILSLVLLGIGCLCIVSGVLAQPAANYDLLSLGFGLIMLGLVIRYQHLRIGSRRKSKDHSDSTEDLR